MPDTRIFRGTGGVLVELDVPREGTQARERHDQQVTAGDLVEVDASTVEWVERGGGQHLQPKGTATDEPEEDTDDEYPADGTVADDLRWISDDPEKAAQALQAEYERVDAEGEPAPRKGVLDFAEPLAEG